MSHRPGFYERYSVWILAVLVFLLPMVVVGAIKAKGNNRNDVKGWLPLEYPETKTYRFFRENFQGEEFILVSWVGCTMDDPRLELLARKLLPPPEEASRIDRPIFFKTAQTGPRAVERMTEEPLNLDTEEAVDRLTGALIGDIDPQDEQTRGENNAADLTEAEVDDLQTCLVLTLSDAARANLHGAIDTIKNVAVEECGIPEETLHMGGPPVDNVSIDRAGQTSVTLLFGLSLVVGFFVSWWSLKSKMLVGLVLASGVYSMFASLAIVWYSGYPVDAILLTMPSLVYVATTSGAIHLANYYRDQLAETGVLKGAAGASVRHALLPLSLATGTTAVGLATLAVSVLVPIKMFGIFSAIGVVVSFIILITFMPACLELFPPKLRLGTESGDDTNDTWRPIEESPWWGVGHWITRHNIAIATICLIVMAGIGYGMTRVESSVQLMRLFSPQARIRQDYRWLEKNLGPLVPMEILIRCDQEECDLNFLERMELVDEIQREIGELGEVGSSLSTVTFGRSLDVGGGGIGGAAGRVFGLNARTRRSVLNRRLVAHRDEFLDGDYLREAKVESEEGIRDQELWRISARVSATKEVDYADFKRDLQSKIDPILASYDADGTQGISVDYTGLVPLVYKAQHSLLDGLIVGFISDFAIIVLVMVLLCRAASAGLVLLLPAAFPAVVVFGGMGWGNALLQSFGTGNLLIDIGTVMAPCVALGVTVDDVVHFMLWFRRGISDGMDRKEATMLAYKGCARAMYQSWGVIGIGLSVFSLSPFGPTQRFGHMMLAMLTVALVGNLVLLPALLAGPLGDIFGWSVLRLNQKKSEKNSQRRVKSEAGTDTLPQPHVLPEPATKQVVHA
ncbi:MAG: MMPL family transporter [Planctomycetaceae bacterium]|nr:MMPL family transporter [Planctomycetaceae bacterium]MBT6919503.1 MMPL family transporter [Planctomycetaceae bacterium]MBT7728214.1 MMPL family transporter [Planctomycetaceae bacterium]